MKLLLGATSAAVAAACILAQTAVAQTALPPACASFTPAPAIPDGATATNAAMNSAREALQQWRTTRAAEIAACKGALDQVQAQLNTIQVAHNQAVTETDAAIAQFAAENAEYTERGRPRR
ncbi:MAG: hypothetical protein ACT4OF_10700 [Caulobacteraceae bacterium]